MQAELKRCHELGHLTEDFAIMAMAAAKDRIFSAKYRAIPYAAREDAFSAFCLKLTLKWQNIDPTKSPKAYIQFMSYTALMDVLRGFNSDLRKSDRVENDNIIKKDVNNAIVTPPKIDMRKLSRSERAEIKKGIIKLLNRGVSKSEIERQSGIKRKVLIRWHNKHKEIGQKFYQQDKREKKKR